MQRVVAFTVRDYRDSDRDELIALYQEVFAGDIEMDNGKVFSWGEYMKCNSCGQKYSRKEVKIEGPENFFDDGSSIFVNYECWIVSPDGDLEKACRNCGEDVSRLRLVSSSPWRNPGPCLVSFWSGADIRKSISDTLERPRGKVKVALDSEEIVGFAMYFVNPYAPDTGYFADIGIAQSKRKKGIATALLLTLNEWVEENNLSSVYLRTDARNLAAVSLFEANGFEKIGFTEPNESVQDNEFRIYLRKEMAAPEERGDSQ